MRLGLFLGLLLLTVSFATALDITSDSTINGVNIIAPGLPGFDNTTGSVNNSEYFDGYSVSSLWTYYSGLGDSIWCQLTGCTMEGDIDMGGNDITNAGDINAENIYANFIDININQTVTVCKDGSCNYNTIQGAIDSITDASVIKRYMVLIHPGTYTENVVLKQGISLQGADSSSTIISSTTGTTLTTGAVPSVSIISDLTIKSNPTGINTARAIVSQGSFNLFDNVVIDVDIANGYMTMMETSGGQTTCQGCSFQYDQTGTGGGNHIGIDNSGTGLFTIQGGYITMDVAAIASTDYGVFILDSGTSTGHKVVDSFIADMEASSASYDGKMEFWKITSGTTNNNLESSHVHLETPSGASNSLGSIFDLDTSSSSGIIRSTANALHSEGFNLNYMAEIGATDTLFSHFDDIVAPNTTTGAGTYTYVNSPEDGRIHMTGEIYTGGDGLVIDSVRDFWPFKYQGVDSGLFFDATGNAEAQMMLNGVVKWTMNVGSGHMWASGDVTAGRYLKSEEGKLYLGGADRDQEIWFYTGGSVTGAKFAWDESEQEFILTHGLTIDGNVTAEYVFGNASLMTGLPAGDNLGNHIATQSLNMSGEKIYMPVNSTHKSKLQFGDAIGSLDEASIYFLTDQAEYNVSEAVVKMKFDANGFIATPFSYALTGVGGNAVLATYATLKSELSSSFILEGRRLIFQANPLLTSGAQTEISDNVLWENTGSSTGGTFNKIGLNYDFGAVSGISLGSNYSKKGIVLTRGNYFNFGGAGNLRAVGIDMKGWGDTPSIAGFGVVEDKIVYRDDGGDFIIGHNYSKGTMQWGDNQEILMGASGDNFIMNFTTDGWLEIWNSTGLGKVRALEYATSTPSDLSYSSNYLDLLPKNSSDLLDPITGKIKPEYLGKASDTWFEEDPNDCWEVPDGKQWCKVEIINYEGKSHENKICERENPIDWDLMEERKETLKDGEYLYKEGFSEVIKYSKQCNKTSPVEVTFLAEQNFNSYLMLAERQEGVKITLDNGNFNGSTADVENLLANNLYTKSKTIKDGVNYIGKINDKEKLKDKTQHYAFEQIIGKDGTQYNLLSVEERLVAMEGFANQMVTLLCDKGILKKGDGCL